MGSNISRSGALSVSSISVGSIVDKTANYQVINTDLGSGAFTMAHTDPRTFTLPSIVDMAGHLGKPITFIKKGAGKVTIVGEAGQYIADSSSGGTIYNDQSHETYGTITLMAISTTHFVIVAMDGTWSIT